MKPEITVIIPAYNIAPWLGDTLRSVQQQTFTNFVCLVIDDGSSDDTHEVFTSAVKGDIRFQIYRQENTGVGAARNAGIILTQTPLITFLDGDDLWHETFLEKMVTSLAQPGIRLACCHYALFYDGTFVRKPKAWKNFCKTGNLWWDMLSDAEFCMGSWAAYTADVKTIEPFRCNLTTAEDRDFLIRLLAYVYTGNSSSGIQIQQELLYYRQRQDSAVRNASSALEHEWNMMQEHINHPGPPPKIRRHSSSSIAFKMAVIAAVAAKDIFLGLQWYARAFLICPWNINLYFLPVRKLLLKFRKEEKIDWLEKFSCAYKTTDKNKIL